MNYCHNCLHWAEIRDTWHCEWCLTFFYANGRMPRPTDKPALTWEQTAVAISDAHFGRVTQ